MNNNHVKYYIRQYMLDIEHLTRMKVELMRLSRTINYEYDRLGNLHRIYYDSKIEESLKHIDEMIVQIQQKYIDMIKS